MNHPEQAIQIATASALRLLLPKEVIWSAIGHGAKLSKVQAGILKAMGLRPGVADLMFIWPHALGARTFPMIGFIEMKAPKGYQSDPQKTFMAGVTHAGCGYAICRSVDEVLEALRRFGCPMRQGRVAAE